MVSLFSSLFFDTHYEKSVYDNSVHHRSFPSFWVSVLAHTIMVSWHCSTCIACVRLAPNLCVSCVCFSAIICCNGVLIICINIVYEPRMYMKTQFIVCLGRMESLRPSTFNYTVLFSTCDWYCLVPCPISYPSLFSFQRTKWQLVSAHRYSCSLQWPLFLVWPWSVAIRQWFRIENLPSNHVPY